MELFQATVRYERTEANGLQKKVNETYLTDALSFTECEPSWSTTWAACATVSSA